MIRRLRKLPADEENTDNEAQQDESVPNS